MAIYSQDKKQKPAWLHRENEVSYKFPMGHDPLKEQLAELACYIYCKNLIS